MTGLFAIVQDHIEPGFLRDHSEDNMGKDKNLSEKIEDKLTIRSKRSGYAGFGFMILLVLTLNTLVFFRGY